MIFISFYIPLDGCEEASLYSASKVQINSTKIITGGEECLARGSHLFSLSQWSVGGVLQHNLEVSLVGESPGFKASLCSSGKRHNEQTAKR